MINAKCISKIVYFFPHNSLKYAIRFSVLSIFSDVNIFFTKNYLSGTTADACYRYTSTERKSS